MNKNNSYFIDTHCHINILIKKDFDVLLTQQQIQQAHIIISQAEEAKVKQIINVATNFIESKNCINLAQNYKNLFASIGIHPNDLKETWMEDLQKIKQLLDEKEKNKIVAVGEIGIDMYRAGYNLERQQAGFRKQIEIALQYDLPIIVHTRTAPEETLTILTEYTHEKLYGVIHCYPYDEKFAQDVIKLNFKLGIGGTVTYPNSKGLQSIVKNIALEHLILETDAPFLAPQSIRGKPNSPAQIRTIAEFIAQLRQESLSHIADITTKNAQQLFKLPSPL